MRKMLSPYYTDSQSAGVVQEGGCPQTLCSPVGSLVTVASLSWPQGGTAPLLTPWLLPGSF